MSEDKLPKVGDRFPVKHECRSLGNRKIKHREPVLVTYVGPVKNGVVTLRGVTCNASRITWKVKVA